MQAILPQPQRRIRGFGGLGFEGLGFQGVRGLVLSVGGLETGKEHGNCRIVDAGLGLQSLGFNVSGLGFKGFRVVGLGLKVWG